MRRLKNLFNKKKNKQVATMLALALSSTSLIYPAVSYAESSYEKYNQVIETGYQGYEMYQKMQEALTEFSNLIGKDKENQGDSSGSNGQREEHSRKYEQVYEKIREGQEEQEKQTEKLQDKINMLRVLAGLGLAIGEFIHEIKYYFPGFTAEIDELKRILESDPSALERISTLESNLMAMKSYTTFFGSTISNNAQRVLEPVNLKEEINSFEKVIARDSTKADITITDNRNEINVLLAEMKTTPMHKSEWASIFFNL